MDAHFAPLRHNIPLLSVHIQPNGSLIISRINSYFEIVKILPRENLKPRLTSFVADAVSHSGAEHHLGALHEVEHHVFEFREESLFINQIEVNFFWRRHLNPNVSFDKIQLPAQFRKFKILHPFILLLRVFFEK